ncbi:MAG: hypothetical protein PHG69_02200 [Candidatus Omnitrophica bacterium]|nr:hypothetical protein [Candidatus Omnitrophota bacterium]
MMNTFDRKRINKQNRLIALVVLVYFSCFTILSTLGVPSNVEAAEFVKSADFLIKTGISLYDKGLFVEAMGEFRKALVIDPNSMVAKEFISHIQKAMYGEDEDKGVSRYLAIEEALDKAESRVESLDSLSLDKREKLLLKEKPAKPKEFTPSSATFSIPQEKSQDLAIVNTITLNEELKAAKGGTVLDLELDRSVIIRGYNIKRFLNNTPEKIAIKRQEGSDDLVVTAIGIGKGIFHVWDDLGRWTFDFTGKQKRFFGIFQDDYENMDVPIGLSDSFKINYSVDWNSFHTGRRINTTQRQSFSVGQRVIVRGETPYGKYDSTFSIDRVNKQYELGSLSMGLSEGSLGKLENINLRIFDFNSGIMAYKFPNADLRGVRLNVPMFDRKLDYTVFHGGLPEGNYTRLSPGLGRTKDAYLEGVGINYKLNKYNGYKLYFAHTYGPELNQPLLTNKAYGVSAFHKIGDLNFNSEAACDDLEHISYTTNANLSLEKTNISVGFTENDRDFASPFGGSVSSGSTTANLGIKFFPTQYFSFSNSVVATRDRNLYNPDDPKRPNYRFDSTASWQLDPHTNLEAGYSRDDTKGSVSPALSETRKISLRKKVFFLKPIGTFFGYSNSISKYFKGAISNFNRNSINGGLSFNVIGDLNFGINKSFNFIENTITGESANSHVLETGLNYYSRILNSPFYGRFRIFYRDEEETESVLSYLSGEDRLEFQSELDYRPNPYVSGYLGCRVANVWAEKEGNAKRIDAEVRYGLRLTWDTGLRWNTVGHVYGFVFNDSDGDGIRDKEEQGIAGVSLKATTNKVGETDEKGYYQIKNIVGKRARVALELSTIPKGHTLTTPSFYDIDIKHAASKRLDFGLTTRAEITGLVFVDTNDNDQFDRGEEAVGGVVFILDDADQAVTDVGGQYLFRKTSPGEHTVMIDLKTLSTKYIPKVALKKKFILEEGATFFYNVPLRKAFQSQ